MFVLNGLLGDTQHESAGVLADAPALQGEILAASSRMPRAFDVRFGPLLRDDALKAPQLCALHAIARPANAGSCPFHRAASRG